MLAFVNGCGIAAVLLIGAYGIGAAVPVGGPPSGGEYQQTQIEQPAPEPAPPAVAEEEQPTPAVKADPCDDPEGGKESDLCQQRRMAEASEELVRLTDRQNWITGIEAGLLLVTIVLSAVASSAAVVAARVAQRTAKHQLRAYVLASDGKFYRNKSGSLCADVILKNTGLTPAYKVAGWINRGGPETAIFEPRSDVIEPPWADLGAGEVHPWSIELPVPPEPPVAIEGQLTPDPKPPVMIDGGIVLAFIWGEFTYEHIFGGKRRTTKFRFWVGDDPTTDPPFNLYWCSEGNTSD